MGYKYLASPYTDPDYGVMYKRFVDICRVAGHLIGKGHHLFVPIAMSHPLQEIGGAPHTWDFWQSFDTMMLEKADEWWVVKLEGWDTSVGVLAEIEIAKKAKLPIKYEDQHTGEIYDQAE